MTNYPTYAKYKDSGVEWLGEIPEDWEIEKGKWLFLKSDRPVRKEDDIVTCFRDGEVTLRKNRRTDGFTNAMKEHGYQGIRKGDLVIHAMDAFAGAIGISDSDGKSTPVYSACTPRYPNKVSSEYYCYLLRQFAHSGLIVSLAKGIRERSTDFRYNDFAELEYYLPSLPEQTSIANFLDEKVGKIEVAVEQKERLIGLLKERKQIIIQNAVTKGLNPNAPMKDSSIEWIGEIPEHWEVKKLKYLGRFINGYAFPSGDFLEQGIRVMKISNIQTMKIDWQDDSYIGVKYWEKCSNFRVLDGDLVFALTRPVISTGIKASIYNGREKILLNQRNSLLRTKSGVQLSWLYFSMLTGGFVGAFQAEIDNTGQQPNISTNSIGELIISYPPQQEQSQIVSHIETASAKIDKAISQAEKQISLLKEYKATLIDSAVTGKIKVTDY